MSEFLLEQSRAGGSSGPGTGSPRVLTSHLHLNSGSRKVPQYCTQSCSARWRRDDVFVLAVRWKTPGTSWSVSTPTSRLSAAELSCCPAERPKTDSPNQVRAWLLSEAAGCEMGSWWKASNIPALPPPPPPLCLCRSGKACVQHPAGGAEPAAGRRGLRLPEHPARPAGATHHPPANAGGLLAGGAARPHAVVPAAAHRQPMRERRKHRDQRVGLRRRVFNRSLFSSVVCLSFSAANRRFPEGGVFDYKPGWRRHPSETTQQQLHTRSSHLPLNFYLNTKNSLHHVTGRMQPVTSELRHLNYSCFHQFIKKLLDIKRIHPVPKPEVLIPRQLGCDGTLKTPCLWRWRHLAASGPGPRSFHGFRLRIKWAKARVSVAGTGVLFCFARDFWICWCQIQN